MTTTAASGSAAFSSPERRTPPSATAAIFGCRGPQLTPEERAFFAESKPWGFILFARNIETPSQVGELVADLRESVGWRAPVLIDQEGGRVARLRRPHWREWPPIGAWTDAAEAGVWSEEALCSALRLRYRAIAAELMALGVDVNCAPLLDVRRDEAHDIIGDRALGRAPDAVARRARAVCEGLRSGGVAPVIKHIPGHGRAAVDSHEQLPKVSAAHADLSVTDFAPFQQLVDQPIAMTAHVVYDAIDSSLCATLSPTVISKVIRDEIGFQGLLLTDDLSMRALSGSFEERARESLAAGCDIVLHCNGDMGEMRAVRDGVGGNAPPRDRADAALVTAPAQGPVEVGAMLEELAELTAPLNQEDAYGLG